MFASRAKPLVELEKKVNPRCGLPCAPQHFVSLCILMTGNLVCCRRKRAALAWPGGVHPRTHTQYRGLQFRDTRRTPIKRVKTLRDIIALIPGKPQNRPPLRA